MSSTGEWCHCPKTPLGPTFSRFPTKPWQPQPIHHARSLALSQNVTWLESQCAAFSDWLLLLSHMHLASPTSFHGLTARFFLSLSNIPLSGRTAVYPSLTEGRLSGAQVFK